jgi:predicted nucleic acid-binding protein
MIRVAFDSNILGYLARVAIAEADAPKIARIAEVRTQVVSNSEVVFPVQALGELVMIMRKASISRAKVHEQISALSSQAIVAPTTRDTLVMALEVAQRYRLQHWDAVIIAASIEAGCTILLSEDMQHGFAVHGLTIINPLAEPMHPKLAALL